MFKIFKRTTPLRDLMHDFHDVHSHLLPAVDDGSSSLEQSMKLTQEIEQLGFSAIYCTPHIIADTYPLNNSTFLREQFNMFKDSLSGSCKLDMRLGAEYLIDDIFLGHLTDNPLTIGGKHMLVEFTMHAMSNNIFEAIFELQLKGYTPIIAHPERYAFIETDHGSVMKRLLEVGCKMQLNLLSVSGWHGFTAKKLSLGMLDNNVYDFVGCDIHSHSHIAEINRASIPTKYAEKIKTLAENNKALF